MSIASLRGVCGVKTAGLRAGAGFGWLGGRGAGIFAFSSFAGVPAWGRVFESAAHATDDSRAAKPTTSITSRIVMNRILLLILYLPAR
jgi:hypothetical protein